jgi:DNA (cytosine-5)-methyltransferase 1
MTIKAIDLFAGAGGFTTGAEQTGAIRVIWAANHWPTAVATHQANHPHVAHSCQDLQQASFVDVPDFDLLLASPACQGHSRARGKDRPHHDAMRSTAWAVVTAAETRRPEAIVVENVPDFQRWSLFPFWMASLQALGYHVTTQTLNAAEWGVPQSRERLFVIGSRRRPIHIESPKLPHVPARTILGTDRHWSPVNKPGRAARILAQIERGRAAHGPDFLVAYYGSERCGRSLDAPLGTVTTTDRFALVNGDRMGMLTAREYLLAQGFPPGYRLPTNHRDSVKLIGNAVPPGLACGVLGQVAAAMGGAA